MAKSKLLKKILPVVMADKGVSYYVDATSGDDGYTGLTSGAPWQTISKVNGETYNPGDKVLFKRGEIWYERLIAPSSGVAGKHIVFGAYGVGDDPIISGGTLMSSWNDEGGNIWNAALVRGSSPGIVWFDDVQGTPEANKLALGDNNDWFWEANVLYIYSTTDPSGKVIEASTNNYVVDQNEKSYLRFENLKIEKGNWVNINIDGDATGIILYNLEIDKTYNYAVQLGTAGAVIPSNTVIDSCTITDFNRQDAAFAPGIWQIKGSSGGDNLVIRNCTITSDVVAINSGNAEDGIIVDDGDNILIENNTITAVDHGIHLRGSGVDAKGTETFVLRYNKITSLDDAFWLNGTSEEDSEIYYNLCLNTGDQYFDIIGEGGKIYNNTCYGGQSNAVVLQNLAATKVIFKNNILSHHANDKVMIYIDDTDGVDITNSEFDNNCYYRAAAAADFWEYAGGGGDDFADWQSTHSQDANGLNENPLYTAFGTDFTLQAGSNCRDAGEDVGLTRDYDGVEVPQETNPSIGAFEYEG